MKKVVVFLADGFEEVEGLTVVDLLRRAGAVVETVSVMGKMQIDGAHGIQVEADELFEKASPTVFGALGLLKEKAACCYPGMEEQLNCKEAKFCSFVTDGNITTSRGVGTAIPFALELIRQLFGNEKASEIAESIVYEE